MTHRGCLMGLALVALGCRGQEPESDPGFGTLPQTETPWGSDAPTEGELATQPTLTGPAPRNLVWISIDTFRKDHWTRYDPKQRSLTPFLDGLLARGFVADRHRTCSSWTYHGVSCGVSGRYPMESGMLPKLNVSQREPWPKGSRFIGDYLRDSGFYTVLSSSNIVVSEDLFNTTAYEDLHLTPSGQAETVYFLGADTLQETVDAGGVDRWFLHLHFLEPHAAYDAPEQFKVGIEDLEPIPWDLSDREGHYDAAWDAHPTLDSNEQDLLEAHLRLEYEAEVRWLDAQLAAAWANLEQRGWLEDTLVVVWTDHGEQFYERGHQSHGFELNVEENDGVLAFWARTLQAGVTTLPTSQIDIVPTTLDLLGLPIPGEVTGERLADVQADRVLHAAVHGRSGMLQSVALEDHQLIYDWSGSVAFYDNATDPGQLDPSYDPTDPTVQALWALMQPRISLAEPLATEHTPVAPPDLPAP